MQIEGAHIYRRELFPLLNTVLLSIQPLSRIVVEYEASETRISSTYVASGFAKSGLVGGPESESGVIYLWNSSSLQAYSLHKQKKKAFSATFSGLLRISETESKNGWEVVYKNGLKDVLAFPKTLRKEKETPPLPSLGRFQGRDVVVPDFIVRDPYGLWEFDSFPEIDLISSLKIEDARIQGSILWIILKNAFYDHRELHYIDLFPLTI